MYTTNTKTFLSSKKDILSGGSGERLCRAIRFCVCMISALFCARETGLLNSLSTNLEELRESVVIFSPWSHDLLRLRFCHAVG